MNNKGNHSDIFESFIKIAQEQGLLAEAEAEHTEKDFHETNPRHDSLSIEQISKLYNNKPQAPKGMEYKKNIMEVAHPDSLVISPSYDKLNGLIESEIEGQNIRLHIVHKQPDGHLTQRKYAEKKLMLSLVSLANDLDSSGEEELAKLADVCLAQAAGKPFHKTAFWPLAIAIGAAVGTLYAKQHMKFHSDGFGADYQKAVQEIDDLLNSNANWGVGQAYTPVFLQSVNQLKTELAKLNTEVQKITPILDKVETPKTGSELAKIAQQPETQEADQALAEFQAVFNEVVPFIATTITSFGNPAFKQRAIAQKGFLSSIVDSAEVLHGGGGLVADDFDDVSHALQTLKGDILNIAQGLKNATTYKQQITQQLENTQAESTQTFEAAPENKEESPLSKMVSPLEDAAKGLFGGS